MNFFCWPGEKMAIRESRESSIVGWWIIMLPQTAVHWLSSAEVGAEFGVEQL